MSAGPDVRTEQDLVAQIQQELLDQVPHEHLVVHDEHAPRSSRYPGFPGSLWLHRSLRRPPTRRERAYGRRGILECRPLHGQQDAKGRTQLELALHLDDALVPLDRSVDRGQPQARPATDILRGEEGFEDALQVLRSDPRARVAYAEFDARASVRSTCIARLETELATIRHRVAGVDAQVEQGVPQLGGVPHDGRVPRVQSRLDPDARIDTAAQELDHIPNDPVEVERP